MSSVLKRRNKKRERRRIRRVKKKRILMISPLPVISSIQTTAV
jgi:hypothetical protein